MTRRLHALVIGNADYASARKLDNPKNDADDIAAKLSNCGFHVIKETDCTSEAMDRALQTFGRELKGQDVGLFFFAGHGFQIKGDNYLAGVDVALVDESAAKYSCLALNQVIEVMEAAGVDSSIIILDACRDNPFSAPWARSASVKGLAPVYAPKGTIIAFATSPGQIASDGPRNRNGRYTAALLRHIDTPDVTIETMFKRVRNTLSASTQGKQISWEHTSLSGEFFFNLSAGARIDLYADTSLLDRLYVIDDSKVSGKLVKALKSQNWYIQNPAIEDFSALKASKCNLSSLFVIGRNIYQAACGSAREAQSYIDELMARTLGMAGEKRKALLDGMLFEVFFDSNGVLRDVPKNAQFAEVSALQQHAELQASFDFIAECLLPFANRFYTIPGKAHSVPIDVVLAPRPAGGYRVEEVYYGGRNILVAEDDEWIGVDGKPARFRKISQDDFRQRLITELLVPSHLLAMTYSAPLAPADELWAPSGYTVLKS